VGDDHLRELVVAGPGVRFAGWLVDSLVIGLLALAIRLVGVTGWPRALAVEALVALDAVALVVWAGGNVGNLVVGTQIVVLDDAARPGFARATIRWLVIRIPAWIAIALGAWWVGGIWLVVVYGPILFTPLRQGLHDRAAGVVVVMRREVGERWTLANLAHRVRR
jgi:hypothetical protein